MGSHKIPFLSEGGGKVWDLITMCLSGKPQKGSASGQPVKPDICSWHWGLWNWTLRPIPVFSLQCLTHPHQPHTCSSRSHFYNAGNFRLSFSPSPFLFLSLFFPLLHPLSFKPPSFLWKVSSRMNSVFSDKSSHKELTMHFSQKLSPLKNLYFNLLQGRFLWC